MHFTGTSEHDLKHLQEGEPLKHPHSVFGNVAWGSKPPTYVYSRWSIALAYGMERIGEDGIEWESAKLEPLGSRTEGSMPADIEVAVNFDETRVKPFVCGNYLKSEADRKEEVVTSPPSDLALRSFLLLRSKQWPNGRVPYVIDSAFTYKQVSMILEGMEKMSAVSCVRWVRRKQQRDYVSITYVEERGICTAAVGRRGREQTIRFNDDCFDVNNGYRGAILHEMMHAIGFIHEQQRLDRDCYVRVSQEAAEMHPSDFGIRLNTSVDFPYDFNSIMHYGEGQQLNSKNGEKLGNLKGELTKLDIMKLNFMYCKGKSFCQIDRVGCTAFRQAEQRCRRGRRNQQFRIRAANK